MKIVFAAAEAAPFIVADIGGAGQQEILQISQRYIQRGDQGGLCDFSCFLRHSLHLKIKMGAVRAHKQKMDAKRPSIP